MSPRAVCPDCRECLARHSSCRSTKSSRIEASAIKACAKCKSGKDTDVYEACPNCHKHFCKRCAEAKQGTTYATLDNNVSHLPVTRSPRRRPYS
mmetsp:Transcript_48483/g.77219  ORF Transcript_48483/g.77219 Transcript_48483/m.77219 type:complete len:94 (-) Transcript_48483:118-399(-)